LRPLVPADQFARSQINDRRLHLPRLREPGAVNRNRGGLSALHGLSSAKAKVKGFDLGRDPERAPLRWDDSPHGGFSSGEPWLPMGKPDINVPDDPGSLLHLHRELIATACDAVPDARRLPADPRAQ
jgi:hypothetical protein